MPTPATYAFSAPQGATFHKQLTVRIKASGQVVDLSGMSARMQVRKSADSPGDPVLSLTEENGRVTMGGTLGTIVLNVDAQDMESIAPGVYVYDLELVNGADVDRYLSGEFIVEANVTR